MSVTYPENTTPKLAEACQQQVETALVEELWQAADAQALVAAWVNRRGDDVGAICRLWSRWSSCTSAGEAQAAYLEWWMDSVRRLVADAQGAQKAAEQMVGINQQAAMACLATAVEAVQPPT